jgi:hypothetical protein
MLKFDCLGCGPKVNPNSYAALLNANDLTVEMKLDTADASAAVCNAALRHVGTGTVVEGHRALSLNAAKAVAVANCTLELKTTITRTIPKGASKLDLSDVVNSNLAKADVKKDGAALDEGDAVANGVITLASAAAADVEITVEDLVVATGTATTDNNTATVNLDEGEYQVHFIARVHDNIECTHMPNPTMMEFVKHCRPLNIRW